MSRRRQAVKRPVIPDPRYNSTLVTNLVNMIMERGKRTVAQRIVYTAFQRVSEKLAKGDPVLIDMLGSPKRTSRTSSPFFAATTNFLDEPGSARRGLL